MRRVAARIRLERPHRVGRRRAASALRAARTLEGAAGGRAQRRRAQARLLLGRAGDRAPARPASRRCRYRTTDGDRRRRARRLGCVRQRDRRRRTASARPARGAPPALARRRTGTRSRCNAPEPRGRRRGAASSAARWHRRSRSRVGSVTVVEPSAAPLERVLGPEVGGSARDALRGITASTCASAPASRASTAPIVFAQSG